jgi:signal transduction histidine kinase
MSTTKFPGSLGRPFSPPTWDDHQHQAHVAQFYADDAFLLDSLSRFVGTALGSGDGAIVIATRAHREGLARILKSRGLDTSAPLAAGRYVCLDAAETLARLLVGGRPDAARFSETIGGLIALTKSRTGGDGRRIAVFGEMVSLLWLQGRFDAVVRLEEFWNGLARTHKFSLLCGYPIHGFNRHEHTDLFMKICSAHTGVIPNESYTELDDEEQRLRSIAYLQQRAQALETEIIERRRAEQELQLAHDHLENRVVERSLELHQKNLQILRQAEALEAANRGLRELSSQLMRVQDEERRRIARELHDSTGQVLALLSMNLSALELDAKGMSVEGGRTLAESIELVDQISGELRAISYLLHPPLLDEMGLPSALRWFSDGFEHRSGIRVNLQLDSGFGRMSRDLETAIFRIVQESLTNIHRHAGSPTATIRLVQGGDTITLQIEDEGKGIAPEKLSEAASVGVPGVGLQGMRERVESFRGEFDITSGEKGTRIDITLPTAVSRADNRMSL